MLRNQLFAKLDGDKMILNGLIFRAAVAAFATIILQITAYADTSVSLSSASQDKPTTAAAATRWPLYAMDPAVRRMAGSLEEKLDTLSAFGYAGVSSNDASLEGLTRVMGAAAERDLRIYALYLGCPVTTDGLKLPDYFDQICEVLGRHNVLLWIYTPGKAFSPSDESKDDIMVPALRAAAVRAAKYNVRVALYHHRDNWVESFKDAIRVAEKIDRPNVGVSFNLCHSLYAGEEEEIPQLLSRAASRLFMVALNGADTNAAGADWDRLIQPIGRGSYDLGSTLNLLQECGYRGAIGFQSFGITEDPIEMLRTTIRAWSELGLVAE